MDIAYSPPGGGSNIILDVSITDEKQYNNIITYYALTTPFLPTANITPHTGEHNM